jgi:tRNA(fMet)-specific endonuclease VapC
MKYLLDTNVCIAAIRGKNPLVSARFAANTPSDLVVCSAVVGELYVGVGKSRNPASEQAKVDAFLAPYQSLPFDDAVAHRYADIRVDLEARGIQIGDFDMVIAAIALAHNLILVTHNTAEFSRVPGLAIEDWEVP